MDEVAIGASVQNCQPKKAKPFVVSTICVLKSSAFFYLIPIPMNAVALASSHLRSC